MANAARAVKQLRDTTRQKLNRSNAYSGDQAGTLGVADRPGYVYYHIPRANGSIEVGIAQGSVANPNAPIVIAQDPWTRQYRVEGSDIAGSAYVGGSPTPGTQDLTPHHETHELGGSDRMLLSSVQVYPLNAIVTPTNTFQHVTIYGGVYAIAGDVVTATTEANYNLSSYAPVSGVKYIWLTRNTAGAVVVIDPSVIDIANLTWPVTDNYVVACVLLRAGIAIQCGQNGINDIIDVRALNSATWGLDWRLAGNSNISAATHFLGSINDADVVLKRNNIEAARLTSTGVVFALDSTVNGLTVGKGANSLVHNTALGLTALPVATTGDSNTAVGFEALHDDTTGSSNVAVGAVALANNIAGIDNAAVGTSSLLGNTNGNHNCAFGTAALYTNTSGHNNVGVGWGAGYSITTGHENTFVGTVAGFDAAQKVDAVNSTAVGNGAYTTADNQVVIGNANVTATVLRGGVSGATLSLTETSNQIVLQAAGVTGTITWTPTASGKVLTIPNVTGTLPLGTGANTQVAYWSGTNTLTGSADLAWDGSKLGVTGYIESSSRVIVTGQATWDSTSTGAVEFGYDPANVWGFVEILARFPGTSYKPFLFTASTFLIKTGPAAAPIDSMYVDGSNNISIGLVSTSAPATRLHIVQETATTNAILEMTRLDARVTGAGVGAAGFGPALTMYGESATDGNYRQMAQVASVWATATDATRKARSVWSVWDTAEREGVRIEASGTTPMVGFLGAAAIARYSSTGDLRQVLIDFGLYTTGGASPLNLNGGALTSGALLASQTVAGLARVTFANVSDNAARRQDIKISTGSAGTEALYFGIDQASSSYLDNRSGKDLQFQVTGSAKVTFFTTGGVTIGAATGGDKGAGALNTAADIYKNNSAYANPDYALEQWVTGRVVKFADNPGAQDYRRMTLGEIESYIKQHLRLPRMTDEPMGIFERADMVLEKLEELYTHTIELGHRLEAVGG